MHFHHHKHHKQNKQNKQTKQTNGKCIWSATVACGAWRLPHHTAVSACLAQCKHDDANFSRVTQGKHTETTKNEKPLARTFEASTVLHPRPLLQKPLRDRSRFHTWSPRTRKSGWQHQQKSRIRSFQTAVEHLHRPKTQTKAKAKTKNKKNMQSTAKNTGCVCFLE